MHVAAEAVVLGLVDEVASLGDVLQRLAADPTSANVQQAATKQKRTTTATARRPDTATARASADPGGQHLSGELWKSCGKASATARPHNGEWRPNRRKSTAPMCVLATTGGADVLALLLTPLPEARVGDSLPLAALGRYPQRNGAGLRRDYRAFSFASLPRRRVRECDPAPLLPPLHGAVNRAQEVCDA